MESAVLGALAMYLVFRLRQLGLLIKKFNAQDTSAVFAIVAEMCLVVYATMQYFVQTLPEDRTETTSNQREAIKASSASIYFLMGMSNVSLDVFVGLLFLIVTISNLSISLVVWGIANAALKSSSNAVRGITHLRTFLLIFYTVFTPLTLMLIATKRTKVIIYPAAFGCLIVTGAALAGSVRIRQIVKSNSDSKNVKRLLQVASSCDRLGLSMGVVVIMTIVTVALGSPINDYFPTTYPFRQLFIHILFIMASMNIIIVVRCLGQLIIRKRIVNTSSVYSSQLTKSGMACGSP